MLGTVFAYTYAVHFALLAILKPYNRSRTSVAMWSSSSYCGPQTIPVPNNNKKKIGLHTHSHTKVPHFVLRSWQKNFTWNSLINNTYEWVLEKRSYSHTNTKWLHCIKFQASLIYYQLMNTASTVDRILFIWSNKCVRKKKLWKNIKQKLPKISCGHDGMSKNTGSDSKASSKIGNREIDSCNKMLYTKFKTALWKSMVYEMDILADCFSYVAVPHAERRLHCIRVLWHRTCKYSLCTLAELKKDKLMVFGKDETLPSLAPSRPVIGQCLNSSYVLYDRVQRHIAHYYFAE